MKTKARKTMGVVKNVSLHAVGICAGLPLIGLSACAKKQVKAENVMLVKEVEVQAGVLHFKDAQSFENYQKDLKPLDAFADFKPLQADAAGSITKLFNQDSLVVVGDEMFKWTGTSIVKKSLRTRQNDWTLAKDIVNLSEINASYQLPTCGNGKKMRQTNAQNSILEPTLQELQNFLARNSQDFDTLLYIANNYKPLLNYTLQDANATAEQKQNAQMLLDLPSVLQKLEKNKVLHAELIQKYDNDVHYFNSVVEAKHGDLLKNLPNLRLTISTGNLFDFSSHSSTSIGNVGGNVGGHNIVGNHAPVNIGFTANDMGLLIDKINQSNKVLENIVSGFIASNNNMMDQFKEIIKDTMKEMMQGFLGIVQTLVGTSSFSPVAGQSNVQQLATGGSRSALIINTIARSGIAGTESEKVANILGEVIASLKLEQQLEYSFYTDLKPVATKGDYDFYYFYVSSKPFSVLKDAYEVKINPYFFMVKNDYSKYQLLPVSSLDAVLVDADVRYQNILGHSFPLTPAEKTISKNAQGYPMLGFQLQRGACVENLDFDSELVGTKIFSTRTGNYTYKNSLIQ